MPKMGPRWKVPFRRKREGKTDYRLRIKLLSSGKPRLVVRLSLRHTLVQVIRTGQRGDLTVASAHSKELSKFGWKAYTGNVPAAYLTGLLCGYRTIKAGITTCVLDLNAHVPVPQGRAFAALKGALDAGLDIPHGENIFPSEERICGGQISQYAAKLRSDEKRYRTQFSGYLAKGLNPEDVPEHFKRVKEAITASVGSENGGI